MSRFLKIVSTITLINIFARLLGFAREVAIGYQYGTSYEADSIVTAFTIPNFLYVVVGGAVTTAFISLYSKLQERKRERFFQTIFTYLLFSMGLLSLSFMVFPSFWIGLFFSGMSEEAFRLTSDLFVVTAPATLFLVLSMLLSGLHNVHHNYELTAFSSLIYNGIYLVIGFSLTPVIMAYSYSLGAMLGSLFMGLMLWFVMRRQQLMPVKLRITPLPESRRFVIVALPLILGGATMQFYYMIQRIYAARLDEGAIAAMNYASKITQIPQGVLMASVTTVVYPMLAKAAGKKDYDTIRKAYEIGFRLLSLILLPAALFMMMYAEEVIAFIFQYGQFSTESTKKTYPLLQVFAIAIFSLALNTYMTRFFYALENTWLPNILNIIAVFGINILTIHLFIEELGMMAIALGTVVSTVLNMLSLMFFAKRKFQLTIGRPRFLIKLSSFILFTALSLYGVSLVSPDIPFFALLIGGLWTLSLIAGGLKFVH